MTEQKNKNTIENITVYIDGASKGNPGEGACAAIFYNSKNEIIAEEGRVLGICTNNFAEYASFYLALKVSKKYNAKRIKIYSDSELLVKQYNGEYNIKNEELKKLMSIIKNEIKDFESVEITHIPRGKNRIADAFVNKLLKAKKLKKTDQKMLSEERNDKFHQKKLL